MKIRVIPTILTNGLNVVKGSHFKNWRTVGNAESVARLFAKRDVDELLLLDVDARSKSQYINEDLIAHFSNVLNIPFSVGGGINTLEIARRCFRLGAEKIVLGTSAIENPSLISEIANIFGTQAVIVALDFDSDSSMNLRTHSGSKIVEVEFSDMIERLQKLGAGEFLVQSCQRDGTQTGMDTQKVRAVAKLSDVPIISSGGFAKPQDAIDVVNAGASAVAVGAAFQFTELTPRILSKILSDNGFHVRRA